ncbi:forkhead box protein R1 [Brachionichthys hirsutus]|uniref:forkhead box protein R1 n=1 Tax=Brachionichthys hirsutus TaxID=412623 RepID=UPI0036050A07
MSLQLKTKARLLDLHCSVGLMDWDMDKELGLATTTDQFHHEDKRIDQYAVQRPFARAPRREGEFIRSDEVSDALVKPTLWLLVNPSIACPIRYGEPPSEPADKARTPLVDPAGPLVFTPHDAPVPGGPPHPVSPSPDFTDKNGVPHQPPRNRRKGRTTAAKVRRLGPDQDQDQDQESKPPMPGCWPRPPVNYCILIALALSSSHSGSLKVQQIYHFTRENFPFFQTAPEGWKNTIRHNLCFNSSFRKTCNQLCRDGKRKSCFWHLTPDGQRRLKDEVGTLTGETFKQLERSMSQPDVIRTLLHL